MEEAKPNTRQYGSVFRIKTTRTQRFYKKRYIFGLSLLLLMTGCLPFIMTSGFHDNVEKNMLNQIRDNQNEKQTIQLKEETLSERISSLLTRIETEKELIAKQCKKLGIQGDNTLKDVVVHEGNVQKLQQILFDVIQTRRPLKIGIVGGSISAGGGLSCKECVFSYILGESLTRILGSPVVIHNAAVGATDSRYYAYCLETHLDADDMDVIFWELAANDLNKDLRPSAQEELTRAILELPNQPQLIYANFIFGKQMRQRSCKTSEDTGGKVLAPYYDVPSLSMKAALCDQVQNGPIEDLIAYDENHPSATVHAMMEVYLRIFILEHLERVLTRFDSFFSSLNNDTMEEERLPSVDFLQTTIKDIPKPFYNDTFITHAQCWSALLPQYGSGTYLVPITSKGWQAVALTGAVNMNRTDMKKCWITSKEGNIIVFPLEIKPYKNLTCTVAVSTLTCDVCGAVTVYIDNEINKAVIVNSKFGVKVTHSHIIATDVTPGKHNITVKTINNGFFQLAAVMTAFNTSIPSTPQSDALTELPQNNTVNFQTLTQSKPTKNETIHFADTNTVNMTAHLIDEHL